MKVDLIYISLFFILSVSLTLALHSSYVLYSLYTILLCYIKQLNTNLHYTFIYAIPNNLTSYYLTPLSYIYILVSLG